MAGNYLINERPDAILNIIDGIVAGVGAVLGFVPQMLVLAGMLYMFFIRKKQE